MGKRTKETDKLLKKQVRDAEKNAILGIGKMLEQKNRIKELLKTKKDKVSQKKLKALDKKIEAKRKIEKAASRDLARQLKWHDQQMKELGELEDQIAGAKDPRRKKALQAELDRRFRDWARKATPLFETLEKLKKLLEEARKIENEVNNIETSDLVC